MDTRPSCGIGPSTMMLNPFHNSENYSFHPKALKQHSVSCTYLGIGGSKSTQECNRSFLGHWTVHLNNAIWFDVTMGVPQNYDVYPLLLVMHLLGWLKLGKPPLIVLLEFITSWEDQWIKPPFFVLVKLIVARSSNFECHSLRPMAPQCQVKHVEATVAVIASWSRCPRVYNK